MSERVNSAWSPSSREIQRRGERKRISRRQGIIAAVSTTVVLGSLFTVLVTSPGWEIVKKTFFDIDYGREVFPTVIAGLWINLQLTFIGGAAIGIIALGLALLRTTKSPALTPFRFLATAYVDIFRGAPLILIILLVGFGVPALRLKGISSNVIFLGTVAVVLTYSAYVAEVIRSGILSIHPSQRAAARSLGLTSGQTMRYVVLPQAIRRVVPPLLNDFVSLLKDTGLVSILGVTDAVRAAQINASRTFNYTPYVVAAVLFLLITIPMTRYTDRAIRQRTNAQSSEGAI
ncbi:polar amino acid transport system permease protein [Candidatus Planktophila vernalis]|jgi:polar amino acid transport system permease protein|uniref:Polar amino acid transport system permease protein n=1 Tax=Candidatus Planktophila vernalis TaxID=1884907 RepID=A0A249KRY7_9ACTN|nr:amino acid ABC transporter permease [Candidatus Planktophila vernalis]ASY19449.1 polar amino acid transport system permease protein [Candidatus Planktophila vernalis]